MSDRYVYQKIQDALKEVVKDGSLESRLQAARITVTVISEGHYTENTPKELIESILAFTSCDPSEELFRSSSLFVELCSVAMQPNK
jgi:hypothetical protein